MFTIPADAPTPRSRRFVWVAVIVFFAALTVGGLAFASSSHSCGLCHIMTANVEGWVESAHTDVTCHKCHADRGVTGWAASMLTGAKTLYAHVTDGSIEAHAISSVVPPERCIACHGGAWQDQMFAAMHPLPTSRCDACHRQSYHADDRPVYHEVAEARDVAYGDAVTCAECHTDRQMLRADIMADPRAEAGSGIEGTGEG